MTEPTQYFAAQAFGGPGWLRWAMLGVIVLGLLLGGVFFAARARRDPNMHSPKVAWLRAWIYYCFVVLFSWVSGVLGSMFQQPLIAPGRDGDMLWAILLAICWGVTLFGYGYWWPRGTLTHGRKLYIVPTLIHGVMWGACAGLLYLSIYAMLEQFVFPGYVNGLILFGIVAVYSMNYQLGWWDIHVSPPHNLRATNNGKVAFAHQPFMIATIVFFILYGDVGMFVLLYMTAMTLSAMAMRFPPFWEEDTGPVSRATAVGE